MDLIDIMENHSLQSKIIELRIKIRNRREYLIKSGLKCLERYKDEAVKRLRGELNDLYKTRKKHNKG